MPRLSQNFQRRGATALLAVYWATLLLATHWPKAVRLPRTPLVASDKLVHVAAYAVLGGLAMLVVYLWRTRREPPDAGQRPPRAFEVLSVMAVIVAAGLLDEVTQPWFNRYFDWYDWLADSIGAGLGVSAMAGWLALRRRRANAG